jgi:hypothetical protein
LARRLTDAINTENAIFEAVGEGPLSGAELKRLTRDVTRSFRAERGGVEHGETFAETTGERRRTPPAKPLRETKGEERRKAFAEAADALLPDMAGVAPAGPALPEHPAELYRKDPAAWHAWARESAERLLPDLPGTP